MAVFGVVTFVAEQFIDGLVFHGILDGRRELRRVLTRSHEGIDRSAIQKLGPDVFDQDGSNSLVTREQKELGWKKSDAEDRPTKSNEAPAARGYPQLATESFPR
jgi:hypothetical protein